MDFDNSQVNTGEVSTPTGGSDSPANSTVSVTSNVQPVSAASLVDSYIQQQSAPPPAEAAPVASATPADAVTDEEGANETPSAGSPEPKGYQSLEQAIEDIRQLREHRKALEPKAKGYDEVLQTAEQYGFTPELVPKAIGVVGSLFSEAESDDGQSVPTTVPFLEMLEQEANPRLAQLLSDSAQRYTGYLLQEIGPERALEAIGLNPALLDTYRAVREDGSLDGQTVGGYDPQTLASIPEELRDVYKSLPLDKQIELDAKTEAARNYELQREKRFADLERKQQEDLKAAEEARKAQIQQQAEQRLQSFLTEQHNSFFNELKQSFSPFGNAPEDEDLNGFMHQAIYSHVVNQLNSNPTTARLIGAVADAAKAGDGITQQKLLAQLNVHVAKHRNGIIERLQQKVFTPNITKAQASRERNANTINVNGTGGFSAGHQPQKLPPIGTPEYLEAMMAQVGLR